MIKENRFFRLRDGLKLYTQIKEIGAPYWIVCTHGLGEHLGRHNYLSDLFGQNFNIFQYDLRGHGKSEGRRAYVRHFHNYVEDLEEVLLYIKNVFRGDRFILLGHSMGSVITASYLQSKAKESFYPHAVILSAPPVGAGGFLGGFLKMFPHLTQQLAKVSGGVYLARLVDISRLSHDSIVKENYEADELNCLKIHSHLALSLINASNEIFSRPLQAKCPLYCAYGSEDTIISTTALRNYFNAYCKEAKLVEVEGGYHELHNEVQKYRKPYFDFLKAAMNEVCFSSQEGGDDQKEFMKGESKIHE